MCYCDVVWDNLLVTFAQRGYLSKQVGVYAKQEYNVRSDDIHNQRLPLLNWITLIGVSNESFSHIVFMMS